jgi:hypothetical protein
MARLSRTELRQIVERDLDGYTLASPRESEPVMPLDPHADAAAPGTEHLQAKGADLVSDAWSTTTAEPIETPALSTPRDGALLSVPVQAVDSAKSHDPDSVKIAIVAEASGRVVGMQG